RARCSDIACSKPDISVLAPMVGGKGGGKADMAQGGGSDASALDAALAAVPDKLSPAG
ncbi:MAG TPA: hypothetical protein EYO66_07145, partial [Gammaproteobacteria bacterium]|nr:hypothetical protein [Gammaproteobacteria bacterium]